MEPLLLHLESSSLAKTRLKSSTIFFQSIPPILPLMCDPSPFFPVLLYSNLSSRLVVGHLLRRVSEELLRGAFSGVIPSLSSLSLDFLFFFPAVVGQNCCSLPNRSGEMNLKSHVKVKDLLLC